MAENFLWLITTILVSFLAYVGTLALIVFQFRAVNKMSAVSLRRNKEQPAEKGPEAGGNNATRRNPITMGERRRPLSQRKF